jgi:hypothetical protein
VHGECFAPEPRRLWRKKFPASFAGRFAGGASGVIDLLNPSFFERRPEK